jgi:hypothetical protein
MESNSVTMADKDNGINWNETSDNNNKAENHLAMYGCDDGWFFSKRDRSPEVYLSNNYRTAHFHPNWSKGFEFYNKKKEKTFF